MKNLTLSIEEDIIKVVRRYAAERDTSVNRLVREYLKGIAEQETRAQTARKRIGELSRTSKARIGNATWTRDELHDR